MKSDVLRICTLICGAFLLLSGETISGQGTRSRLARAESYALPSSIENTTLMEVLDDKRPLRVADRLSMRVVEDRKPPVALIVTDSGEVEVPLIGRIPAKGKTCKQLAYSIKGPLEREYYYKATVIVGLDAEGRVSPGRVYCHRSDSHPGARRDPA